MSIGIGTGTGIGIGIGSLSQRKPMRWVPTNEKGDTEGGVLRRRTMPKLTTPAMSERKREQRTEFGHE